jgi:GTP pyrophosphokinase
MERMNVGFEQLSDVMAFRILVDNVEQCYQALGIIHGKYPVVPDLFNDFISTPKPNGYRSLHTTVIGPHRQRIEIQIRTHEMHETNELGVAAHWAYKQGAPSDGKQYRWLRELLEILDNAQRPEEFLEHTKLELFQDQVFCFTPKGDLISLPRGATIIDFAYAVHSQVGNNCVGAKVNGRIAPLNTVLKNGDQVEIATSKKQTPSPTWERFVVTGKARAHIRRFIRQQQRDEYINLGRAMLQKVFKQEGYEFTEKAVHNVIRILRLDSVEEVYVAIGSGSLVARDVFKTIFPSHKPKEEEFTDEQAIAAVEKAQTKQTERDKQQKAKKNPLTLKGLIPGMAVHYARCCHPLYGDRIVGIITTGKGVTIHTIDCETLESFSDSPERWIDVSWEGDADAIEAHNGRLTVHITNKPGALATIFTVIAKNAGNVNNLKITTRTDDFWELFVDVQVKDVQHLTNIVAALRATPEVYSVERTRSR